MSYQVLARKYRPSSFEELEGQEHVLQALVNALDNERLHHAYLFTGTRGVGKTTIARILARCLNCETGITSKPCGECSTCREISEGRSVDLIEVDAASRTGVDDMRELLDNVQYMPTVSRFKIYLIDEVHMLSRSSFNAMLKTLEEPPEHVKFLFATTDPKKLPITVLSRCLQFNLKNHTPEQIVHHLGKVLSNESIEYDESALWQLGHAADGSMRDALSLTDQAISFGAGEVRDAPVKSMLGSIDNQEVFELLDAISRQDGARLLERVASLSEFAPDFSALLDDMLSVLHRVAIAQAVPDAVDNAHGDKDQVLAAASQMSPEQVQLMYQIGLIGQRDLPLAPVPRVGFEMVLLRMMSFSPDSGGSQSGGQSGGDEKAGKKRSAGSLSARSPAATTRSALASARQDEAVQITNVGKTTAKNAPSTRIAGLLSAINGEDDVVREPRSSSKPKASSEPAPEVVTQTAAPVEAAIEKAAEEETAREETLVEETLVEETLVEETHVEQPLAEEAARAPESVDETPEVVEVVAGSAVETTVAAPDFEPANWSAILVALNLSGVTGTLAANCQLESAKAGSCLLKLAEHHASLWNAAHEQRIAQALSRLYDRNIMVSIEVGTTSVETPAQQSERRKEESHAKAVEDIQSDQHVQQLIENFNGRLDPESISPLSTASASSIRQAGK
jgi:DNA polymerase-3 subunit gamma/tau